MILILMGAMGSGKSTIGKLLAYALGWIFYEGDDFHSNENIKKMREGVALDDQNRLLWLQKLRDKIQDCLQREENAIIACSALKQSYRNMLAVDQKNIKLIYLKGDYNLLQKRIEERQHHYMNKKLLPSQWEILEEPKKAIYIDISLTPEIIVKNIIELLRLKK